MRRSWLGIALAASVVVCACGPQTSAHGAGPALVDAPLAGADIVALSTAGRSSGILLYGDSTIRTLDDLRGKSLAVTRAGTLSDFTARYALTQQNLRPEVDVGLIQTGGNVETLAQYQSVIEFTATREPRARELQPERLIDDRFVRTLDQEGFIDRLYQ